MRLLSVLTLLLVMSCSSTKHTKKNRSIEAANSISLERTSCFGTCPVYLVIIFADGSVSYEGKMYVDQIGSYSGQIDENKTLALFDQIAKYSWDSYPEKYPIDNYDFPQFHLAYKTDKRLTIVKANTNAPEELILLSKEIDRLLKEVELVKD